MDGCQKQQEISDRLSRPSLPLSIYLSVAPWSAEKKVSKEVSVLHHITCACTAPLHCTALHCITVQLHPLHPLHHLHHLHHEADVAQPAPTQLLPTLSLRTGVIVPAPLTYAQTTLANLPGVDCWHLLSDGNDTYPASSRFVLSDPPGRRGEQTVLGCLQKGGMWLGGTTPASTSTSTGSHTAVWVTASYSGRQGGAPPRRGRVLAADIACGAAPPGCGCGCPAAPDCYRASLVPAEGHHCRGRSPLSSEQSASSQRCASRRITARPTPHQPPLPEIPNGGWAQQTGQ